MVKGYEFAKDQYVIFTPEELKAMEEAGTHMSDEQIVVMTHTDGYFQAAMRAIVSNLDARAWFGFWAPARTPKGAIARLNAATVEALADPGVRARLADLAREIFPREQQTPAALADLQKAEIEKWWPIIKAANIKGE